MTDDSLLPSFSLCYHGCDRAVADAVLAGRRTLRASVNDYDWLGSGIYIWESDATRAMEWARELRRRGTVSRPAVVGAVVDLGECLNLLDRRYLKLLGRSYRLLKSDADRAGLTLPRNRSLPGGSTPLLRSLDCAVVNCCRQLRVEDGLPPFDTVRAAFVEGPPVYPTAGFNDRNHIQVCVVNRHCVKGYFRPLNGGRR